MSENDRAQRHREADGRTDGRTIVNHTVAAPGIWNSLPLNVRTDYNSLRGFKTNLRPTYSARTIFSQCHAAPQITVI